MFVAQKEIMVMGWEERNGRLYYYRKRRIGGRVVSEYIGAGFIAEIAANLDESEHGVREYEKKLVRDEMERERAATAQVDQLEGLIRAVTRATLLMAGYHTHRGQWRCRRD